MGSKRRFIVAFRSWKGREKLKTKNLSYCVTPSAKRLTCCKTKPNQTKPNQTRTIAVTVAVAAHQKFINMKTGYSATISLRLRRIKVFAKTN
jgi:hypothetical protein